MDASEELKVVKFEVMRDDLKNLLAEFAQSFDLNLEIAINDMKACPDRFGRPVIFDVKITAHETNPHRPDASSSVKEVIGEHAIFENNWHRFARARGLNVDLLNKVIEVSSPRQRRLVRYKVLGLNTTKRIKYCVSIQDMSTGKTYRGAVPFINAGKVVT